MSKNKAKTKAWLDAARAGDLAALKRLADDGINLDVTGDDGRTALMNAAGGGHVEAVRELLARKASATLASHGGKTALAYALGADWSGLFSPNPRSDRTGAALLLIQAGCRPDAALLAAAIGSLTAENIERLAAKTKPYRKEWLAALHACRRNPDEGIHASADLEAILVRLSNVLA